MTTLTTRQEDLIRHIEVNMLNYNTVFETDVVLELVSGDKPSISFECDWKRDLKEKCNRIENYKGLTSIKLCVNDIDMMPKDHFSSFLEKITKYFIQHRALTKVQLLKNVMDDFNNVNLILLISKKYSDEIIRLLDNGCEHDSFMQRNAIIIFDNELRFSAKRLESPINKPYWEYVDDQILFESIYSEQIIDLILDGEGVKI